MTSLSIAEQLGGSQVLHQEIRTDLDLVEALQQGLPPGAVDALLAGGGITADELYRLVIPRRTLALRRQKNQPLTPEESDKLARVARILGLTAETFQNPEKAHRWLRKPNRGLAGQIPLELLATEAGARLVEQALLRISHGIFA
jgi:putative toxin-antitoxin system antitoxin component (TIGR02293 family)